jgi:peptidoglycan/LPS O-acetylase OafA/YrhL
LFSARLFATIALAAIMWYAVEKPFLSLKKHFSYSVE